MNRRARRAEGTIAWYFRVAAACALWSFVTVLGLSAAGMLLSGASYAGASDERVESFAADTYATFLRSVLLALAKLAVAEWALITFATMGLVQLYAWTRGARGMSVARRHVAAASAAVLCVITLVGFGAAVHPGLFLGALAASRLASIWASIAYYLAPGALAIAVLGHFAGAARAKRPVQIAFVLAAAAVGAGAGRARSFERRYRPTMFTIKAPADSKKAVTGFRSPSPSTSSGTTSGIASETSGTEISDTSKKSGYLPRRPASVLWIAVDSLRPDHIDPVNTPHLAALVAESVYYPNTITPVPRTGPSWAAALTSLEPLTSGIETMFPDARLSDLANVALPAHLGHHGYRSIVVSEYAGEFFRRIKVGFDEEAVPRAELMQISGQIMMGRAPVVLAEAGLLYGASPAARSLVPAPLGELIRGMPNFSVPSTLGQDARVFLDAHPKDPAFVLAFYSQPHFPYTSSPRWAKKYHVRGSDPALAYGRDVASDRPIKTDADRKQIDGLYRAALAETDAAVGELLANLRKTGWLDDAIVILSADHGEGLYECDECVGHGDNLRGMMTLRVPLAFRLPKKRFPDSRPVTVTEYASLLDVYPTLLELLGITRIDVHEGLSIIGEDGRPRTVGAPPRTFAVETGEWLWTTAAVPKDRLDYPPITALARLDGDRIAIDPKYEPVIRAAKHRAVIRAPYKLLYEPSRAGVRWRLFDIEADPLEKNDLSAQKPEVLADLKEALRRSVVRHGNVLPVGDYFLTRPQGVPDHHW